MKTLLRPSCFALAVLLGMALLLPGLSQAQCVCPSGTVLLARYESQDRGDGLHILVFEEEEGRQNIATISNYLRDSSGEIEGFDWTTTPIPVFALVLKSGRSTCEKGGTGTSGSVGQTPPPAISHADFCVIAECADNQLPQFSGPTQTSDPTKRSVTITDNQGIKKITFETLNNIEVTFDSPTVPGTFTGGMVDLTSYGSPTTVNLTFNRPANVNPGDRAVFNVVVDDGCVPVGFDPALDWYAGETPEAFRLGDNYPNPFNPATTIRFQVAEAGPVTVTVHDMLGRRVQTLIDRSMEAGYHEVVWDGRNASGETMASGMYFYRMQAGDYAASKTMLLVK